MFDPEVSALLATLNETFPTVQHMTGAQARVAVAARRQPATNLNDVRSAEDRAIDGTDRRIRVRVYQPHVELKELPVVVFYHGGGFVFCDLDSHDGFCRALAKNTESIVVSVDYRLAPEHPAPAAALDAFAALRWAAEHASGLGGDPERIVVMGDSAGGNLTAVVALMARDTDGPSLRGQILIYPMLDPDCNTESYERYGHGFFNTEQAMRWYWRQYLGDHELAYPAHLVAPARAESHERLPPAIVITAGCDPLRDEGEAYAARLANSGVPVVQRTYSGLFHGFLTIQDLRAAESARQILWDDMRRLLDRQPWADMSVGGSDGH